MKKTKNNGTISIRIGVQNKAFLKALSLFLVSISCDFKYTMGRDIITNNTTYTHILCEGVSLKTINKCVTSTLKTSEWDFATNIIKLFDELNLNISSNDVRKIHSHNLKQLYQDELKRGD